MTNSDHVLIATTHARPDNSFYIARVIKTHSSSVTYMAYDITGEFRTFVYQKRKGPGDSRRTKPEGKPPHFTPGDIQTDGAPPFMQVYMKEAYTIVSHLFIVFVTSELLRVRSCNKSVP
jgi:hypothetical protein